MQKIATTAHARQRMQQRAITDIQAQLIEQFGVAEYQKGGSYVGFIPEKKLAELRRAIDKLSGITVIYGNEDVAVTAMHQNKRIRRTRYAA